MKLPAGSIFVFLSTVAGTSYAFLQKRQFSDDSFDWATVKPSRSLQYHDCYDGFKCARLKVPLDWTTANSSKCASSPRWAAIGIVTLPASVPETDPSFGGTILINPGGPGGGGTEMVLDIGLYMQAILDADRHYEILGFDPRGVALSTPRADCYNDDLKRAADFIQKEGLPAMTSGPEALTHHYQAARGLSDLCAEAGEDSIFNYMSTASVARDMVEIVDRVDELRHKNLTSAEDGERELPKLQYFGISYGTILGNTFASMFPGRVGRMVLDGVADADDYISGTWAKNLNDAEVVVDKFYETCFRAGELCLLKQEADGSAADIRKRVDDFIQALVKTPIVTVAGGRVRFVTSLIVRDTIRRALYSPIKAYELLSIVLATTLAGDYSLLLQSPAVNNYERKDVCVVPGDYYPPQNYTWDSEAGMGVLCGDSASKAGERNNVSWAESIVEQLDAQSPTAGEPWARIPLSCSGWRYRPKYAFRGPFGHLNLDLSKAEDKPAAPLLILSTRHDHATPLANAEHLSTLYPGSAVVIQESVGHCALITSRSECTAQHLRTYFDVGKVPRSGTTCEEDCSPGIPFVPCPGFADTPS
ncbi:putative hydrolase like protein [Verticillium longisporum]|uniref:Putative hydrolase like protein n=1 Tax=Verticillium longisporum TaxID=100787 RepID=A0A8I2ZLR2_VERLO|nr:putative hydrolase like protein [Verticillium longisporum]